MLRVVAEEAWLTEFRGQEGHVLWVSAPGLDLELYVAALADAGFATVVVETASSATELLAGSETPDVIYSE